jgi:DnaJ-class molecular chaperone
MAISLDAPTPSPYNYSGGLKGKRKMEELVTCPVCEGKGWINLPHTKKPESSVMEGNITRFLDIFGHKEKPKLPYKTCPNCNGLGMVRK